MVIPFSYVLSLMLIQWGSEIRPFENRKHSKTGHFGGRFIPFENRTKYVRFSNGTISLDRFI